MTDAPGTDLHVGERRVRSDDRVLADHGAAVQLDAGMEGDIRAERHVDVDPRGRRIDDGDAGTHPPLEHPAVQLGGQRRELDPVVHPGDQDRVLGVQSADRETLAVCDLDDVGQVQLALGVVGVETAERRRADGLRRTRTRRS